MGKAMVKDRFGTANAYFAIDKLVSGAVRQLQRTLGRITDSLLGSLPGADSVKSAPAEESVKPRFCSECGTPLKAGMAFCGNCGKKVG